MATRLTGRQKAILNLILQFISDHGLPPTVRELAGLAGISAGTVQEHLRALEKKGAIRRNQLSTRNLEIIGLDQYRSEDPDYEEASIPVVGEIAAGTPILAEENVVGSLSLKNFFFKAKNVFALRVRGDSMIEDGILDGDYAFVRQQKEAHVGDIIAAMVWGEATIKRYYPEGGIIRLQPANPLHNAIFVTPEDQDFRIVGKVIRIFREL